MSKQIKFVNNKSDEMYLDDSTTISQLIQIGCERIRFGKPDEPLEDHWWMAVPGTSPKGKIP